MTQEAQGSHAPAGSNLLRRVGSRTAITLLGAGAVILVLITAGAFIPIPVLDILGSLVSSVFVWFIVAAGVLIAMTLTLRSHHRTRARSIIAVLSAVAVVGSLVMGVRLTAFAFDQHLPISAGEVLFGSHLNDTPDKTVTYLHYRGKAITLSIWKPSPTAAPAPVIVMTHGGGFTAGSVTTGVSPAHARWFADHGYLVIGANYTLSTATEHTWNVDEGQIACALAWSGKHASTYGGDISRLAMFGDSAGGNLAINTAYKAAAGKLTSSCGGRIPKVDAISGIYPAVATVAAYDNSDVLGIAGRQFLGDYHGGSPDRYPNRYSSTQSANAATAKAPPTLIVYGESDHLVPGSGTRAFIRTATSAGIATKSIAVPFGEHGFDAVNMGGIGSQVWRLATLKWFENHGAGF